MSFVDASVVARLDLSRNEPTPRWSSLNRPAPARAAGGATAPDAGRGFARAAFAATFVGDEVAVVAHQESVPVQAVAVEDPGVYGGGGGQRPIGHRLSFVSAAGSGEVAQARIGVHQPRGLAYDGARDVLYVAGFGTDEVLAIGDASRQSVHLAWRQHVVDDTGACGPTGIDVDAGGRVWVFCSLSRRVGTIEQTDEGTRAAAVSLGAAVTTSRLTAAERRGRALFRQGDNAMLSMAGAAACTSCHPEGRTDGLSWRIEGHTLQTPVLAGRLHGTHPFKWDGGDPDLKSSLQNTVKRLGGHGIDAAEAADLAAFLKTLPPPRPPRTADAAAVARGEKLFRSEALGCAGCHDGPALTDRKSYDLAADLDQVDTPSLIGLASSAPYYHDGSAATLRALLLENGTVHGMGSLRSVDDGDVDDLIAYLRTL